jgi:cytoskeletal protein RodZ
MRTIGQIFKETRIQKGFTLEQVEKATKIRARFLIAIEADDTRKMPAAPYSQGFIKNYSEFLGLSSATMLALFRRQFQNLQKQKKELVEEPLTQSRWRITPNKVIVVVVLFLIGALFTYFYTQYRELHAPPQLILESPADETVTKDEIIPVFGITDTDATLTVNADPLLLKDDGRFYKDIPLTVGNNTPVIEATSRIGAKTTIVRRITRAP